MKLYTTPQTPNHRRVSIFLAEKHLALGTDVAVEEIDIRGAQNLDDGFRQRNPFGRIPVLELDNGHHIAESVAICRYFEVTQPEPNLFGTDAEEQAVIEMWCRRAELNFMMPVAMAFRNMTGFFKDREEIVEAWGEVSQRTAAAALPLFDEQLGASEFLAGDRFSVADIVFGVAVDFAQATKRDVPLDLPNLSRWREQISARPSWAN